jgi:hypothetical protein
MADVIRLEWHGPLRLGNLPESREEINALKFSAVYLYFRCYDGFQGKTPFNVGKSKNFARRLGKHFGDFLSSGAGTLYLEDFRVSAWRCFGVFSISPAQPR